MKEELQELKSEKERMNQMDDKVLQLEGRRNDKLKMKFEQMKLNAMQADVSDVSCELSNRSEVQDVQANMSAPASQLTRMAHDASWSTLSSKPQEGLSLVVHICALAWIMIPNPFLFQPITESSKTKS